MAAAEKLVKKKAKEKDAEAVALPEQRYELVDGEDDLLGNVLASAPTKKKRKARTESTGPIQKTPDVFIIDPNAEFFARDDGGSTRISIAKRMMQQLTEDVLLTSAYKNRTDKRGRPLSTEHWECMVASSDPSHQRFHLEGGGGGGSAH